MEISVTFGAAELAAPHPGLHVGASAHGYSILLRHALAKRFPSVRIRVRSTPDSAPLVAGATGCASEDEARTVEEGALEIARELQRDRCWLQRLHADELHALLWVHATLSGLCYAVDEHGLAVPSDAQEVAPDADERLMDTLLELGVAKVEALIDEYVLDVLEPRIVRGGGCASQVPVVAAREVAAWYLARHRGSSSSQEVARAHAVLAPIAAEDAEEMGRQVAAEWIARFPRG